jgi:hypothetical protein
MKSIEEEKKFVLITINELIDLILFFSQQHLRSNSEDIETMNRRLIVPSGEMNQHHYAGVNPIQPFSYARQQPTPPKKHIQHDTDV